MYWFAKRFRAIRWLSPNRSQGRHDGRPCTTPKSSEGEPWRRVRSAACRMQALGEERGNEVAALMGLGFHDDPLFAHACPNPGERARWLPWLFLLEYLEASPLWPNPGHRRSRST